MYYLENEQWHLTFTYLLFQIYFQQILYIIFFISFKYYFFIHFLSSFILFLTTIFLNEKCYIRNILCYTFTTNFTWKVVTSSNLNSPLKLFFFSPILTNNNMLFKIYCEILWQYCCRISQLGIFFSLYYFLFFHFILLHTRVLYPPSFISLSPQETSSNIIHSSHHKEREREREIGLGLHCCSASPPPLVVLPTNRLVLFFFFFFHICLFWFNFILRIGFCFVFGLILFLMNRSLSFLWWEEQNFFFEEQRRANEMLLEVLEEKKK